MQALDSKYFPNHLSKLRGSCHIHPSIPKNLAKITYTSFIFCIYIYIFYYIYIIIYIYNIHLSKKSLMENFIFHAVLKKKRLSSYCSLVVAFDNI